MKYRKYLPYILFAAMVCLFLWRPIFLGKALLPGDYLAHMFPWNSVMSPSDPPPQWNPLHWDAIAQFYPWRVLYARSMAAGEIPLWNPHQFSGTPFLANGQSAVFYPFNLIFLLVDPITAFTLFAAVHLFMAQVFMYWLLRELRCSETGGIAGAIVFAFSAFMVLWLELPTFIGVAVWLPLALLLVHRAVDRKSVGYGVSAGAAVALSLLAGHLQIAFYVLLAVAAWWAWRFVQVWREHGRRAIIGSVVAPGVAFAVTAALLPAAQVIPSLELGAGSHRVREANAAGYERFIGNATRPYRLVTAFAPNYFGCPANNDYYLIGALPDGSLCTTADYMEHGLYAGVLPLFLAAISVAACRRQRFAGYFIFLGTFALMIALGTVVNAPFYYLVPGFSAFGGPNRILLLYLFSVAALTGFGLDALLQSRSGKTRQIWLAVACCFAAFFAANFIAQRQAVAPMIPLTIGDGLAPLRFGAGASVVNAAAALMALCLAIYYSRRSGFVPALLVAVVAADLISFGINYNPTCSRDRVYPDSALTEALQALPAGTRIAAINPRWSLWETPAAVLPPNSGIVYGLNDVSGYDSLFQMSYKQLTNEIEGMDSSPPENGNIVFVRRYTERLREIADVVLSTQPLDHPNLSKFGEYSGVYVYRITNSVGAGTTAVATHSPFSFRLGLFLSLVGVSVVCAVSIHALSGRRRKRGIL